MPKQSADLNRIFNALADPTRRAVLERLCKGEAPVSELAQPFDMALASFSQHLDVLERCGLVQSEKTGRVRTTRRGAAGAAICDSPRRRAALITCLRLALRVLRMRSSAAATSFSRVSVVLMHQSIASLMS